VLEFYLYARADGFVKSSNSRRANFVIMRRTCRTLNDYEMQHNAEVGLSTTPSRLDKDGWIQSFLITFWIGLDRVERNILVFLSMSFI